LNSATQEVNALLKNIQLPDGYFIEFGVPIKK